MKLELFSAPDAAASKPPSRSGLLQVVVAVVCFGATVGLLRFVDQFAAVRDWLFWKLGLIWLWQLVFVATGLSLGGLIGDRALRGVPEIPPLERLVLEMAVGVVGFAVILWILGAMRLLVPAVAVALPALSIAASFGRRRSRTPRPLATLLGTPWQLSILDLVVGGYGVICLGLLYLNLLDPESLNHDAHWTHLPIAQDFAREGRIVPSRAEWARNFPHLASVLYTWVFLVPGLDHPMRLLMVMHTELVLLIWTLVAVVAAARWLTHASELEGRTTWVVFFLFSAIFVYDSNLGGAADHVAAFFVLPLFLAFARGTERFSPGLCALAGALAGGALVTKYQSAYVIAPLGGLVVVRCARALLRRLGSDGDPIVRTPAVRSMLIGLAMLTGGFLAAAGPYFIENIVFHRNPVYPFGLSVFTASRPTIGDAGYLVSNVLTPAGLKGGDGLAARLQGALGLLFSFSFVPHYSFVGARPYFGFLFTLLAPLSLLFPRGQRLRMAAAIAAGTISCWAMTYLVDRNLQIFAPLLVAVTAAVIVRIWRMGGLARLALVPLLLAQAVWGGDLMFQGSSSVALERARSGAAGLINVRSTQERRAISRTLPRQAVVLLHEEHVTLGLDREVISDKMGYQGLLDGHLMRTPREAYDRYRAVGVTHLVWDPSDPLDFCQGDVVFDILTKPLSGKVHGGYHVAEMPASPPPVRPPLRVLALGTGIAGLTADGVYPVDAVSACDLRPPETCVPTHPEAPVGPGGAKEALMGDVDAVLLGPTYSLDARAAELLRTRYEPTIHAGTPQLHLRR